MQGLHFGADAWTLMAHGFVNVVYDRQTGPRGDTKSFTGSMAMLMGSRPLGSEGSAFAYVGLPGEPALGPSAFMHRFSGMRNPEAPLTHHWLDSTHITFGVATLGASQGPFQLEGSWFNGREPDQFRWNIETRKFDSWSTRLSFNPTPELSMQVSYGDLKSPEQLAPDTRVQRTTASISYQRRLDAAEWG